MKRRSHSLKDTQISPVSSHDDHLRREMERVNAQMRHFMGVSASTVNEAINILGEIAEACSDSRTAEQILEDAGQPPNQLPLGGWDELRRKLDLLKHYLDYVRRLCDGSIASQERRGGATDAREI